MSKKEIGLFDLLQDKPSKKTDKAAASSVMTVAAVQRFLKEKSHRCPQCQSQNLHVYARDAEIAANIIMQDIDEKKRTPTMFWTSVATYCEDCGYINRYSKHVIARWLAENKKA